MGVGCVGGCMHGWVEVGGMCVGGMGGGMCVGWMGGMSGGGGGGGGYNNG